MVQEGRPRRRRAVALLMTLMLVLLLVCVTARLVTTGGVEAIRASRRVNTLQHRLAVDSVLRLAAADLAGDSMAAGEYPRTGVRIIGLELGDCRVRCRVVNDGAKFNVKPFATNGQQRLLARKLRELGRRLRLPEADVRLRPARPRPARKSSRSKRGRINRYCWYDQLFGETAPGACFRWGLDTDGPPARVWSDVVTLFGDGRVDVRHAHPEVLRVLLADLDRSAAEAIIAARETAGTGNPLSAALQDVDSAVREGIRQRLTTGLDRYALTIETAVGGDRRQWYVVATLADGRVQTVHYRGQITW